MVKLKNLIILLNIFIAFFVIELFINYILDFRAIVDVNTCKRIYNKEKDFSFYSPNCENIIKHWEQDNFVSYKINSEGRRDLPNQKKNVKKIAFLGDSFTFGAMVPIEDNYNFYAFNKILKNSFEIHNFGTPAEQLHNIINKLKTLEVKKYDYIVYGLTPNDFFDLVDGSYTGELKKKDINKGINENKKTKMQIFKKIKGYLLSTATSRFILHNLMSNDTIYLKTYISRKPYSGYLLKDLPAEWLKAIDYLNINLKNLDYKYKSKLKIFILPQRAEVVSSRLNLYNSSFVTSIINICNENRIDCSFPDLNTLSKVKESHFPVDGHLSVNGNHDVAQHLSKWAKNWN
tara:strand:- start:834 stop:1871 length:1038 start_codon:yes stop_codon:yes gene_type:complete